MTGQTHLSCGIAIGTAIALNSPLPWEGKLITIGLAALGSLIPDIDTNESMISHKAPLVRLFFWIFVGGKHRGVTHQIISVLVLSLLIFLFGNRISLQTGIIFAIAFGLGVMSHIMLDNTHIRVNSSIDHLCRILFRTTTFVLIVRWIIAEANALGITL